MERVVHRAFLCQLQTRLERLRHRTAVHLIGKIDQRRNAADRAGHGAVVKIVHRVRTAERQQHVRVRFDRVGEHRVAAAVDRPRGRLLLTADKGNPAALDADIDDAQILRRIHMRVLQQ